MKENTADPVISELTHQSDAAIELVHLRKAFGTKDVLRDISIRIPKGENLVVLGKSGSGKSVLIKCLVGLVEPDEGEIMVMGRNISGLNDEELNAMRKKIGFLFQSGALYDSMTVRENLLFPLKNSGIVSKNGETAAVEEALENVGLKDAIDKMPSELSGGMRKRLGLARTLILRPEIMLYDEPTTGLDPITSKEISLLMVDVQKKYMTTSIIITHDIPCARITATGSWFLKKG